jgi:hypothetical protein
VGSRDHQAAAGAGQEVVRHGLGLGDERRPRRHQGHHFRVVPRHCVADDGAIGLGHGRRVPAQADGNAQGLELGTHGRIQRRVHSLDPVTGGLEQSGQGGHGGASDGQHVEVFRFVEWLLQNVRSVLCLAARLPKIVAVCVQEDKEERMHSAVRIGMLAVAVMTVAGMGMAQAGPKLVVDPTIADLGDVSQGDVRDVTFELRNEGDGTLTIKAVRPTCGCTVVDYDKEIAPGAVGKVDAKLDTAGFNGPISKSILVMTDDPINPTTTLAIKANVKPYIEVLPRPLVRFNALQLEEVEQKVVIAATERTKGFSVTGVKSDNDAITPAIRKLEASEMVEGKSAPQYELTLTLAADAPVGPLNSVVTVETDNANAKRIQVRVFGVVRALLQVSPPELQFGAVRAAESPARTVVVVNNKVGESIQILDATIDDPAFETELKAIEEGRRYHVTVAVQNTAGTGIKDATLTLRTTDDSMKTVTIPVRASLR